jgi:hypothetical protein
MNHLLHKRKAKVNIMNNSINNASLTANLPADSEENRTRRQLLFLGAFFAACASIAYLRMDQIIVSDHSVPLLGALLGM